MAKSEPRLFILRFPSGFCLITGVHLYHPFLSFRDCLSMTNKRNPEEITRPSHSKGMEGRQRKLPWRATSKRNESRLGTFHKWRMSRRSCKPFFFILSSDDLNWSIPQKKRTKVPYLVAAGRNSSGLRARTSSNPLLERENGGFIIEKLIRLVVWGRYPAGGGLLPIDLTLTKAERRTSLIIAIYETLIREMKEKRRPSHLAGSLSDPRPILRIRPFRTI